MSSNALAKALDVLEAFQNSSGALTVKDVAELNDETQSSVQRSIYTLETLGYLEREEAGKRYVPGRACLRPVYGYLRNNRFLETATPYLIDLSERFATRADLTVLEGTDIVYLSRIPSRDELLNLSPLGRRWPAIHTASGRAILAAMKDDERDEVLSASSFSKTTPHSLTTLESIVRAIEDIKKSGYSYQSEEVLLGAASVGAAIVGTNGEVQGAIILGGAVEAFQDIDQRHILGNAVKQAARAIGAYI
ncbi:IclR family transcriptional regulator [Cohaesibacter gelatinilyticus]|uniref:Transcriptional regulator, IclR family n=1 Tax=Cohaesibacter gelatinilyticus TaxID=372072 RepID=A0A285PDE7_9HYPH|nr:IclR family transcriptional regulator [Cohaesibacter gelatinilyticus]SNZ19257.1 transcriptional regulator, IclR family [Cohaesibacter gelatinilyticus]